MCECFDNIDCRAGLCNKLTFLCTNCNSQYSFRTSQPLPKYGYEANVRFVYGLRCIGRGHDSGKTLCAVMNLPPPPTQFRKFNKDLCNVLKTCAQNSMTEAIEEAVVENEGSRDLVVTLDGTWQKRGVILV